MIQEVREWIAKVDYVLKDGIILSQAVDKHPFEQLLTNDEFGKIRDVEIFSDRPFEIGDTIKIRLTYIDKLKKNVTIKEEGYIKWYSIVYEVAGNGFYTKEIKQEDRFARIFSYKFRTHITDNVYLNNDLKDNNNPFEVGDIVMIELHLISS